MDDQRIVDLIDDQVKRDPDRACLVFGDEQFSYREVQLMSIRLASGLSDRSIPPGAKFAVLSTNHPMCMVVTLALLRIRCVWVPVNPRDSIHDIVAVLRRLDVDCVAVHSRFALDLPRILEGVPSIKWWTCLDTVCGDVPAIMEWADEQATELSSVDWEPSDLAAIFSTGGTTGVPKGVMFDQQRLTALARHWNELELSKGHVRRLAAAPLTHVAGRACLAGMTNGTTTVVLERFDPAEVLQTIERERITALTTPPTMLYMLLAQPDVREYDYSSLETIGYGAAPITLDGLKTAIDVFGPVMTEGYGQTEAPMVITRMEPAEHFDDEGGLASDERLRSCGRATPFVDLRIVDEEDRDVKIGAVGEILVLGDFTMVGYYNDPEATQATMSNGYVRTGDLGRLDDHGYLTIVGRKKDMIISGGFNVYPAEVESALAERSEIYESAVVGVPDPIWGETVVAVVLPVAGAALDPDEIRQWARERLGSVKAPKRIVVADDLPRNTNGKVTKHVLLKQLVPLETSPGEGET